MEYSLDLGGWKKADQLSIYATLVLVIAVTPVVTLRASARPSGGCTCIDQQFPKFVVIGSGASRRTHFAKQLRSNVRSMTIVSRAMSAPLFHQNFY